MSTYRHTLSAREHARQVERHLRLLVGLSYAASQEARRRSSIDTDNAPWTVWTSLAESALAAWEAGTPGATLEILSRLEQRVEAISVLRTIAEIRAQIEPADALAPRHRFKAIVGSVLTRLGHETPQTA